MSETINKSLEETMTYAGYLSQKLIEDNSPQGSDEWKRKRKGVITSTTLNNRGIGIDESLYNIVTRPDITITQPMAIGTAIEPIVRDYLRQRLSLDIKETGIVYREGMNYVTGSPDGVVYENGIPSLAIEIKSSISYKKKNDQRFILSNNEGWYSPSLSPDHVRQLNYTMGILGIKKGLLVNVYPNNQLTSMSIIISEIPFDVNAFMRDVSLAISYKKLADQYKSDLERTTSLYSHDQKKTNDTTK